MRSIGMLRKTVRRKPIPLPIISEKTSWVRAPESGILRTLVPLGAQVSRGQTLAMVADPLGVAEAEIIAPEEGMVIGRTNLPLVYEGDATFHIAQYGRKVTTVEKHVEQFQEEHQPEPTLEDPADLSTAPIT
jgi:predicted deacylase